MVTIAENWVAVEQRRILQVWFSLNNKTSFKKISKQSKFTLFRNFFRLAEEHESRSFMCVKINTTWDTYFYCKGIVSRDEYFLKAKKVLFASALMVFTVFGCLFVKKIKTKVSARFYKILVLKKWFIWWPNPFNANIFINRFV